MVFQPHLYSRTRDFAVEFAAALAPADAVVLMEVYGAGGPHSRCLVEAIAEALSEAEARCRRRGHLLVVRGRRGNGTPRGTPGLVLTVGAGDVTMVGPEILRALDQA